VIDGGRTGTSLQFGAFPGGAQSKGGTDVATWTKRGARIAVVAGASFFVGAMAAGGALLAIHAHRPVISYEFDAPAAPFGGGGTCYGCWPFDGADLESPSAGVASPLPSSADFRGIVVTSDRFPRELRDVRVMPDGYYLEFADGRVRFVDDGAPWVALAPDLEPEWTDYLVREGVIDPA
jgi:hypothetical protein